MDLSRFSIDQRLQENADTANSYSSVFYEKLLSGLFEQDENLLVKTDIEKDRARVFMFPVIYWLTQPNKAASNFRALYVVDDEEKLEAASSAARALATEFEGDVSIFPLKPLNVSSGSGSTAGQSMEQDLSTAEGANLVLASVQTLISLAQAGALPTIAPRHFGFVVVDGAEKIAELPDEKLRAVQGHLLPSWERKTLVIEGKSTPRAKAFAWDIADNPKEIRFQESIGLVGTIKTASYEIRAEEKLRFVLGLAHDPSIQSICLFCNLKSSAFEISKRLELNGVPTDYVAGALQPSRKKQILEKALTGGRAQPGVDKPGADTVSHDSDASSAFVLVLTDEGAKDIERARFPVVVNFDIPLEPELYADRLTFLDQHNPNARLYNLACERYMYGIPAIRRSIDPSLTLIPFTEGEKLPLDASEGVTIERETPRGRDTRGQRDSRDQREPRKREPRESGELERRGRRDEHRPHSSDRSGPSKANQKTAGGAFHGSPSEPTDLYAMTMEERMELYRKKYGRNFQKQIPREEQGQSQGRNKNRQQKHMRGPAQGKAQDQDQDQDKDEKKDLHKELNTQDQNILFQDTTEKNEQLQSLQGQKAEEQRPEGQHPEDQETEKGHSFLDRLHGLWGNQK